jgi:hypothetical protein
MQALGTRNAMVKLMQPSEAWEGLSSRTLLLVLELVLGAQARTYRSGPAERVLPSVQSAEAWSKAGDVVLGAVPARALNA